jgi:hypothetical protein
MNNITYILCHVGVIAIPGKRLYELHEIINDIDSSILLVTLIEPLSIILTKVKSRNTSSSSVIITWFTMLSIKRYVMVCANSFQKHVNSEIKCYSLYQNSSSLFVSIYFIIVIVQYCTYL